MTNTPSVKPSFFSELRRRRVFRVIGVYAGAGFALLEFVDIVAPILQLPTWSTTLVLALLGIGFPIAAILAWIFDIPRLDRIHPSSGKCIRVQHGLT